MLEFDRAAAAIIKHTNPCGVAQADTLREAYVLARECDPVSAFGSVVALNRRVEEDTATEIGATFVEVVLAPDFSGGALEILTHEEKSAARCECRPRARSPVEHREIGGGFLVQDEDLYQCRPRPAEGRHQAAPSTEEMEALCSAGAS